MLPRRAAGGATRCSKNARQVDPRSTGRGTQVGQMLDEGSNNARGGILAVISQRRTKLDNNWVPRKAPASDVSAQSFFGSPAMTTLAAGTGTRVTVGWLGQIPQLSQAEKCGQGAPPSSGRGRPYRDNKYVDKRVTSRPTGEHSESRKCVMLGVTFGLCAWSRL